MLPSLRVKFDSILLQVLIAAYEKLEDPVEMARKRKEFLDLLHKMQEALAAIDFPVTALGAKVITYLGICGLTYSGIEEDEAHYLVSITYQSAFK